MITRVKSYGRRKKNGGKCVVKAYNKKVKKSTVYKKASPEKRKMMLKRYNVGERWNIK